MYDTADGLQILDSPVELGSWSTMIYRILYIQTVVGLGISEPSAVVAGDSSTSWSRYCVGWMNIPTSLQARFFSHASTTHKQIGIPQPIVIFLFFGGCGCGCGCGCCCRCCCCCCSLVHDVTARTQDLSTEPKRVLFSILCCPRYILYTCPNLM